MSPIDAPAATSSIVTGMMFCVLVPRNGDQPVEQRGDLRVVALAAHALQALDLALGGRRVVGVHLDVELLVRLDVLVDADHRLLAARLPFSAVS